ncbi:4Fe-4S dicluster domain-containing protein, partial [bacterium]
FASDPDNDVSDFVSKAKDEQLDQVLIGCCASPSRFDEAFSAAGAATTKLHFVNLKESCFLVHPDPEQAHAKATRLLRAAIESAEAKDAPAHNPLNVGGRILIAADGPQGRKLADKLRDVAQPLLVVPLDDAASDGDGLGQLSRGRVVEIKGRLGDFRVTIEDVSEPETTRRELKADQVVIISQDGSSPYKARTGCHLVTNPSEADLDHAAEQIRELTGEFLKPVQVGYETDICAGGTADHEACGICITACPYDAIGRDPENHLRIRVDQMACEGCGACVSACPTSALHFTEPSPHELYTRMAALLTPLPGQNGGEALTILFHCGEQGRRALEEAGRRALPYPATVLPVEVPCLRYVSEANMLAAFRLGAAGVGLLGCERCQHGKRELLYQKSDFCRLTLDAFGLDPERLRLITADDGTHAEAVAALTGFAATLKTTPIRWDGKPIRYWDNREVIAEAISTFIEQTGREPGRRTFDAPYPFAFADVKDSGCTMCRSCVNACPTHAFKLDEKSQSLQFKHIACVACGLCETVCPEKVITLRQELFFEREALEYRTVVQDDMVSCANCGKPYINRKALEAVEARVLSLESLLDTFTGNRKNLLRMCPDCRAVVAMLEVDKGWKP